MTIEVTWNNPLIFRRGKWGLLNSFNNFDKVTEQQVSHFPDSRLSASQLHDGFLDVFIYNLIFIHFNIEQLEFTNEFIVQTLLW